jgi:hypothetical protein
LQNVQLQLLRSALMRDLGAVLSQALVHLPLAALLL